MNFKLLIQYDGTDFHGWQIQENSRTIQGELERVIGMLEDDEVKVSGSGRTDAGVHAEGQVANVYLRRSFSPDKLRNAINGNLWRDIRIMNCSTVADDFHARFSAKSKTYIYRVINAPVMTPFWHRFAHLENRPLDVDLMSRTARTFLGEHDWTAFCSAQSDGESRVRNVTAFTVESRWEPRGGAAMIEFRITASGFLRYMVRSIVGTVLDVGRGDKDPESVPAAIVNGDRSLAGRTAPPNGLTLYSVHYENQ
jgi:tRNA pseudouridine38-40 synthase